MSMLGFKQNLALRWNCLIILHSKYPVAEFMPSVRNKYWDGKIRLLNVMTGMIYRGLIPYVIKFCNSRDYTVTVDEGSSTKE